MVKHYNLTLAYSNKHMKLNELKEDLGKPVFIQLEKGLSRKDARKMALSKRPNGDYRGFYYDPKTGKARWI
jgi:hypothetical protein